MGKKRISQEARAQIIEFLITRDIPWCGRRREIDFLSTIYDLKSMPSFDDRYLDAYGDIFQHRENNLDGPVEWVFSDERFALRFGTDANLLNFLTEVVSPFALSDVEEQEFCVQTLNSLLDDSGFEFEVYKSTPIGYIYRWDDRRARLYDFEIMDAKESLLKKITNEDDESQITRLVNRTIQNINLDPEASIGAAKDLLEAAYKQILVRLNVAFDESRSDMKSLRNKTFDALGFKADALLQNERSSSALFNLLEATGISVAIVRNTEGAGHGKVTANEPDSNLARLIAMATIGLVEYLLALSKTRN